MLACDSNRNTSAGIVIWVKVEEVDVVKAAESGDIWGV